MSTPAPAVSGESGGSETEPVWRRLARGLAHRPVQERLCALFLVLLSIFLLVNAVGYGLFQGSQPGPGLFPTILSALLLLLSVLWLIVGPGRTNEGPSAAEALVLGDDPSQELLDELDELDAQSNTAIDRAGAKIIAFTVVWSLVPIFLLDRIGFLLAMIPYVSVMLIVIARLRWWVVVPLTIVGTFLVTLGSDLIGLSLPDPFRLFSSWGI